MDFEQISAYCHAELYILKHEKLGVKFGYTKNSAIQRAENMDKIIRFNANLDLSPIRVHKIYRFIKFKACACSSNFTSWKRKDEGCVHLESMEKKYIHQCLQEKFLFSKEAKYIQEQIDRISTGKRVLFPFKEWYDLEEKNITCFELIIENWFDDNNIRCGRFYPSDIGFDNDNYCVADYKNNSQSFPVFPEPKDKRKHERYFYLHR